MRLFIFRSKFLLTLFLTLPLIMCSDDESGTSIDNNEDGESINNSQLVELTAMRSMSPHNTAIGIQATDGVRYPNVNLSIGMSAGINVSYVIGDFGANDADANLDISMEVARKRTIDKNIEDAGQNVEYRKGYAYNLLDGVITKADYNITPKNSGTLFISTNNRYRVNNYPFTVRADNDGRFSARFFSNQNGFARDDRDLSWDIYFEEDDVFSFEEMTSIPMRLFVDFRMLLHLRFLVRNGARDVNLMGRREDGTEISFDLQANSDLVALSDAFENNDIDTIVFSASGDYRIDFFNGFVFPSETPPDDKNNHSIIYRFGEQLRE